MFRKHLGGCYLHACLSPCWLRWQIDLSERNERNNMSRCPWKRLIIFEPSSRKPEEVERMERKRFRVSHKIAGEAERWSTVPFSRSLQMSQIIVGSALPWLCRRVLNCWVSKETVWEDSRWKPSHGTSTNPVKPHPTRSIAWSSQELVSTASRTSMIHKTQGERDWHGIGSSCC